MGHRCNSSLNCNRMTQLSSDQDLSYTCPGYPPETLSWLHGEAEALNPEVQGHLKGTRQLEMSNRSHCAIRRLSIRKDESQMRTAGSFYFSGLVGRTI